MRIVHLGGNVMGDRVLEHLRSNPEDTVASVSTLGSLREVLAIETPAWLVSAGFRHLIPAELLEVAGDTCNVHPSLLPWGRGAQPNIWAIARGEPAGVTIHRMASKVDAGPIFAQRAVKTTFADTGLDLYERLQDEAVRLFVESWAEIRTGSRLPVPPSGTGSYHHSSEMRSLAALDLNARVTWLQALNTLRALTHPPYENVVIETEDGRYVVEVRIARIDEDRRENPPRPA